MLCAAVWKLLMATTIRSGSERIRHEEHLAALSRSMSQARVGRNEVAEPEWRGGGEEGILPVEQRPQTSEKLQSDPPPLPPTDLTRPPEW